MWWKEISNHGFKFKGKIFVPLGERLNNQSSKDVLPKGQEGTVTGPALRTFPGSIFHAVETMSGEDRQIPLVNKMPRLNCLHQSICTENRLPVNECLRNRLFTIQTFLVFPSLLGKSGNLGLKSPMQFSSICAGLSQFPVEGGWVWDLSPLSSIVLAEFVRAVCEGRASFSPPWLWGWCGMNLPSFSRSHQAH